MILEITPCPCPCLVGADNVATFVLEMACRAELGTQRAPLRWCGVVARQGTICSGQQCAHSFLHRVAFSCVVEVQKQADSLGSDGKKAARMACALERPGLEKDAQELPMASVQKAEDPQL